MSEMAIQVKDLSKVYKLYNKPSDRLKETLGFHVDAREHYAASARCATGATLPAATSSTSARRSASSGRTVPVNRRF